MTAESIWYLIPEAILILAATVIYVVGGWHESETSPAQRRVVRTLATAALFVAGLALIRQFDVLFGVAGTTNKSTAVSVGGPLSADLLSTYIRGLSLFTGLVLALMSFRPGEIHDEAEQLGTLLMAIAGAMLVGSARNLVLLFVGLELVSIPTYVLLYIARRSPESQEATVKYFFLSIVSSAVLLYGFSFLYGASGSTDLDVIYKRLADEGADLRGMGLASLVAMILIVAGLGFRIAAVPFHFYAPDVYQGTTHSNAALLSVVPKIVGFVAMLRLLLVAMPGLETFGWRIALILAMVTMTLGNTMALWQNNVRRLFAYSSIAHAGYMLIGIAVHFAVVEQDQRQAVFDGAAGVLFYLVVYALATLGTFAAFAYLGTPHAQVDDVDQLAGAGRTHPFAAIALSVFMFSLAGIPPLAGFWGKLTLFTGAVETAIDLRVPGSATVGLPVDASALSSWLIALAVVGALNAAVAAAYYLRIVAALYFRPAVATLKGQGGSGALTAMLVCMIGVVGVGLFPASLERRSRTASASARVVDRPAASQAADTSPVSRVAQGP